MSSSEAILSIRNLSVCYGDAQVLDAVNLSIGKGEIVGVVGESGSGKSTLLKAIARLLPPGAEITSGSITYDGRSIDELSEREMRMLRGGGLGFLFQDAEGSLDPLFTIKSQFDEVLKAHRCVPSGRGGFADAQRKALERVGLIDADRILGLLPSQLSGGMGQRVALAFALALAPTLLLADEPTSALDGAAQEKVVDILRSLNAKDGLSILLVSHDMDLVSSLADTVVVMHDGHVVEAGSSAQIMSDPQQPYTQRLIDAIPRMTGKVEITRLGSDRHRAS